MSTEKPNLPTSDEALQMLMDGNKRYTAGQMKHRHQDAARRAETGGGQAPFAIILGCADSRVAPEVVFDQGLGDLFVIRVAGNIAEDDAVLGSIEYAAAHLHTPLVIVLGHSSCGAVGATAQGGDLGGHLPALAKAIKPAVDAVRDHEGDLIDNAVRQNARMVAEQLRTSQPILADLVAGGSLKVVAARYDLDSGVVELL